MNFASLFAGVGGFDLGFERAGMTCAGQVEIDPNCRKVLATHWPEVPRWEDIHDVTASDLYRTGSIRVGSESGIRNEWDFGRGQSNALAGMDGGAIERAGAIDVLCGGFPCQDYSVAGLRGGLAGDRGALWWQFHRLIAECRPQWVVGENVPGLLSSNGGRDFGAIVGSLVQLGYGVVWRVLDAQYFGVAQRRRRVFIVGHIGGIPRPEVLDFAQGCAWDTPPRRTAREEGAAGAAGSPPNGSPLAFNWQSGQDQLSARETHIDALHVGQIPAVAFTQNTRDEVRDLNNLAGALAAQPGMKQTNYLAVSVREDQRTGAAYEMPYTSALANGGGKPGQGYQAVREGSSVRRLTPLECERLQGFPDGWTAGQKDTQRYRQMGNAVAVPVAEWVGRRIVECG